MPGPAQGPEPQGPIQAPIRGALRRGLVGLGCIGCGLDHDGNGMLDRRDPNRGLDRLPADPGLAQLVFVGVDAKTCGHAATRRHL